MLKKKKNIVFLLTKFSHFIMKMKSIETREIRTEQIVLKMKKVLRWFLITVIGTLCIAGIGYFAPALQQDIQTDNSRHTLIQNILNKQFPKIETNSFSEYDLRLKRLLQHTLQIYLQSKDVEIIVKTDAVLRQNQTVRKEILPDSAVIRSEHTEQKEGDVIVHDKKYDYSIQTTQSHSVFYDVKKINIFVFMPQTVLSRMQASASGNGSEYKNIEDIIFSVVDFDKTRGDVLQIFALPALSVQNGFLGEYDMQIRKILAVVFICFFCIFVFAVILIPWIIRNFYRVKPVQLNNAKSARDLYQYQIVGNLEDNLILKAQNLCAAMPEAAVNILRNRMAEETQQTNHKDLFSPAQKAAIILLCMGEKIIKQLFKYMTDSEIFSLSRLMASLGHIKAVDIQPVLLTFCQSMNSPQDIRQTKPLVEAIIKNTLPIDKAETLLDEMKVTGGGKTVWDKMNNHISAAQLSAFLSSEYPQTAAVILYHLTAEKAAAVLAETDEQTGSRILVRLSALQYMNPDNVRRIEIDLEKQIELLMSKPRDIGLQKASAILSLLDKKTQNKYLTSIKDFAPQTGGVLSKCVFTFDDLARWSSDDLGVLMKHIDMKTLVLALSNANQQTKKAFARVMSPQKWGEILKKINQLPTGKVQDIDISQRAIIQIAHQLVESKKCKGRVI